MKSLATHMLESLENSNQSLVDTIIGKSDITDDITTTEELQKEKPSEDADGLAEEQA